MHHVCIVLRSYNCPGCRHLLLLLKLKYLLLHLSHHLNDKVKTVLRLLGVLLYHRLLLHLGHLGLRHLSHHLDHLLLVHFNLSAHRISSRLLNTRISSLERFGSPWLFGYFLFRHLLYTCRVSSLLLDAISLLSN